MLTLAQTLGFIFGPLLQGVFTALGGDGYKMAFGLHFSMYTAPGWLNVILALGNLFFFLPRFFQDRRVAAKEQMLIHGNENEKAAWKAIKPDYLVAWILIFSLFVFVFNFVLLEGEFICLKFEIFIDKIRFFSSHHTTHYGSICLDEEGSSSEYRVLNDNWWNYCLPYIPFSKSAMQSLQRK